MLAKTELQVPSLADRAPRTSWEIDRHIPVALIFTVLLQGATLVWWARGVTERIGTVEAHIERTVTHGDRLTKIETKLESIIDSLKDVKDTLTSRAKKPLQK